MRTFAPSFNVMRLFIRSILLVTAVLAGALCVHLFTFSMAANDTDLDYQRQFSERYRIFSLTLPENLTFCGEKVPMEKIDVRERMDRELLVNTYWHSNSILSHKRAHRWFPIIEPILARNGVPDDMKYLALIESGLTNVVSPAGATGFWQFMKETAIHHGMEVNVEVDERYNLERSTEAACAYLKEAIGPLWLVGHGCGQLQPGCRRGGQTAGAAEERRLLLTCCCPKKHRGTCSASSR